MILLLLFLGAIGDDEEDSSSSWAPCVYVEQHEEQADQQEISKATIKYHQDTAIMMLRIITS